MSRLRRIAQSDRIFFVTTNVSRNVPHLRPDEIDLLLETLENVRRSLNFLLIGYVVMPDHAHLLFGSRVSSLSRIMHQWKFKTGYAIQYFRHHSGAFWQPCCFDFVCRRSTDVSDKLFYIHQNPVVANLVTHPEDWKWSRAAFYLRKSVSPIRPDVLDLTGDPNAPLYL